MLLAYIDESGDRGAHKPAGGGGSQTFVLAAVIVDAERWPDVFDDFIAFRRFVRTSFEIPVRAELKATHLVRGGGIFRKIQHNEAARRRIYRLHMRLASKLGLRVFAVVIDKARLAADTDPRDIAWETMLQRLERMTSKSVPKQPLMIIHDEGEDRLIRGMARKARRHLTAGSAFGTGTLRFSARWLVDDPASRQSHQSYFIQLADLAAYAAFRHCVPPPSHVQAVVPQGMWEELGDALFTPVNSVRGGPRAIVLRP